MKRLVLLLLLIPSIAVAHDPYGSTLWGMFRPIVTSDCSDTTEKLIFNTATRQFECGTDQTGGGGSTLLDQSAGETDLRYDATFEAYYYDTDGGGTRATDGTEPFVDTHVIEVPGDYTTIQAAVDSDECKDGSTTANQGCVVRFKGTLAQSVVIGSASSTPDQQWSIIIEGTGTMGQQSSGTNNLCASTLSGDGTLNGSVITVDDSIGVVLRNFCIDMDPASGNDPKYGIVLGGDTGSATGAKFVTIENISMFGNGAANGAGIKLGNSVSVPPATPNSDTAFNVVRNVYMEGLRSCFEVDAVQAVGNTIDNVSCANPTDTIGGIDLVNGQLSQVNDFYFSPSIANQIGINVHNNSLGISLITGLSVEWDNDNGVVINYDDSGGTGNLHAQTILGGRINIQTAPTTRHKCINWDRAGTLNILGLGVESDGEAGPYNKTCEFWFRNASAGPEASYVNMQGVDVEWSGTQPDLVIDESSAGGPLIVTRDEHGKHAIGEDGTLIFEGATLNGFETTVTVTDPTADRTVTLPDANSNTVVPDTGAANNFLTAISSAGVISKAQPSFSNVSGTASDAQVDGSLESDEITGLTDGQISDTLTASTSTTAAANDNDTSIATTAFVQQEIDDGDLLSDNCVLENDSTPIPDSCVGDGSDGGGGPTILGGDVPCAVSASYCTIWTIAGSGITASRALYINAEIMVDADSTTVAPQFRVRSADTGYTGNCWWTMNESTTATTAPASDIVAIGTAPGDTAGTTWFSTAPQPVELLCSLVADASPGDIIVEFQLETGTTPTQNVLRGSHYTLTQ